MKCSKCGREATTHLRQNINGKVTEVWLCGECAEEMGVGGMFSGFGGFGSFGSFGLGGFGGMESLLGSFFGDSGSAKSIPEQTRCSLCGSTFRDISERGKAGCANCYDVFGSQLQRTIERIHGRSVHNGKLPGKSAPAAAPKAAPEPTPKPAAQNKAAEKPSAEVLRAKLREAVANEEYEKAAQLRDEIRALEAQN